MREWGIDISTGAIDAILTGGQDSFHAEKDELLERGLASARYVTVDDSPSPAGEVQDVGRWAATRHAAQQRTRQDARIHSSPVGKLARYADHPDAPCHNNFAEQQIKHYATGKRWYFCYDKVGAQASADLFSLVLTCRANEVDRFEFFEHLPTATTLEALEALQEKIPVPVSY